MVARGELRGPIVIGRDHLDAGSVASPNRETEAMRDGSDAVSDWPLLNALLNTASGATWVSIHHGGGVGMGFSQHAGMVMVADGTEAAARRLARVLWNDPAIGRDAPRRCRLRRRDRVRARTRPRSAVARRMRVVIVGGGAIGSSSAYHLATHPGFAGEIVVVERDPSYARASSALSASGIRQQFSTPVSIGMSQYGLAFIRAAARDLAVDGDAPELGFKEHGYLFLATAAGVAALRENVALQRAAGADIALLDAAQLGGALAMAGDRGPCRRRVR